MDRSLYIAMSGAKQSLLAQNSNANNLANMQTTGFKSDLEWFRSRPVSGDGYPTRVYAMIEKPGTNFSPGTMQTTGRDLDVAINGEGFFTKVSPVTGKTFYTRNGNFTLDGGGFVTDVQGSRLQVLPVDAAGNVTSTTPVDAQAPLVSGTGFDFMAVTIKADGSVIASYADGSVTNVGKVALASFVSPGGLLQIGGQDWQATGISGPATYGQPGAARFGTILSGSLEQSNVDIAEEMVGLITAQRYFQANAKAIDTATQLSQTIINLRS